MSFLPIAILAYALNGGALLVSKIQLQTKQLNPISYTFWGSITQLVAILLFPFGFEFNQPTSAYILGILSGIAFVFAVWSLFQALNKEETSVVGPVVAGLNPLFALILGSFLLVDIVSSNHILAILVLVLGSAVLTSNLWIKKLRINSSPWLMILSGALFGISYVFLRMTFLQTDFINGLIISRVAASLFALSFLALPPLRMKIFVKPETNIKTGRVALIFLSGQIMSGLSNFLLFFATSLASPALVNSLFGVQYLIILAVALALVKKAPQLLDENLSRGIILQKVIGAGVLSLGVYLLSK